MQISFNPYINNNLNFSFAQKTKEKTMQPVVMNEKERNNKISQLRTKKIVSELKYVALFVGVLYFTMKRNFKINKIIKHNLDLYEISRLKKPARQNITEKQIKKFLKA